MDPIVSLARAGRTRKELRRMIGTRLGDLMVLRATGNAPSNTTFTDSVHLNGAPDRYAGRYAYFCGGQDQLLGITAYVQSSSASERTLTFAQALPTPSLVDDEIHLVNWSGVGFSPDDYHYAMNDVILSAGESHYFVPMRINVDQSYDATTNTIQLPPELRIIEGLDDYREGCGWQHMTKARDGATNGWYIDRPTGQIVLLSPPVPSPGTNPPMRISGYGVPLELTGETDTCSLPTEWFVEECAARMLEKNVQMNPGIPNRDRIYNVLRQHADAIRPELTVRMGPFAERVV